MLLAPAATAVWSVIMAPGPRISAGSCKKSHTDRRRLNRGHSTESGGGLGDRLGFRRRSLLLPIPARSVLPRTAGIRRSPPRILGDCDLHRHLPAADHAVERAGFDATLPARRSTIPLVLPLQAIPPCVEGARPTRPATGSLLRCGLPAGRMADRSRHLRPRRESKQPYGE